MKQGLLGLMLMVLSSNALAWGDWYGKYDKAMHVGVSAAGTVGGYYVLKETLDMEDWQARLIASAVTFAITGPIKEATDINWDNQDMAASGVGTVIGLGVTFAF